MTADVAQRVGFIEEPSARRTFLDQLQDTLTGFRSEDPPLDGSPLESTEFDADYRDEGLDWPATALTMVGRQRLQNFRELVEQAIVDGVPGDIVEAGVWRGGASIMARATLVAWGDVGRRVHVCDSFEGLPPPDVERFPADEGGEFHTFPELAVSLEEVQANFARFGLLDEHVAFVKGWFRDTMPTFRPPAIAVLRLDGDMYESTIDPLENLYDLVSPGGWVIIDDYRLFACCQEAVADFAASRGFEPELESIDRVGVYWRKPT